ncbi:hypothetical protein KP803_09680 [Vibrio sp. ZSDE26]|uniref:Uncharacterized protein n=1 Tax=Vibrio amylolyticus TaxID=2847292 RepID=A0A9X2BHZ1_9VIBR|nr:hypothetical protein [Vibrio amylolyticus]MCK6263540.1 hypothetical protein [Vibrio amylolyticus]
MTDKLKNVLFRDFGTHAVKKLEISEARIVLVVAPWTDLTDEVSAVFQDITLSYVEAQLDSTDEELDLTFPWDIIRLDSTSKDKNRWHFGLCCSDIIIGFDASWPHVKFSSD